MIENSNVSGSTMKWGKNFFLESKGIKTHIDARIMQPFLYNELYEKHNILDFILSQEIKEDATLYKSPGLLGADYGPHMQEEAKKLLKDVGKITPSKTDYVLFGNGCTNLIYCLIHIFAKYVGTKNIVVTEESPFYDTHKHIAEENGCEWIPSEKLTLANIKDKFIIEIVTSPNNPDGEFRKPLKSIVPHVIIADLVYDWPWVINSSTSEKTMCNQVWIDEYTIKGSMVFPLNSFSKSFGLAGQRCGFALWPINYSTKSVCGMHWDECENLYTFRKKIHENNFYKKDAIHHHSDKSPSIFLDSCHLLSMAQKFIAFCTYGISPDAFYACQAVARLYLCNDQCLLNALKDLHCILVDRRETLCKLLMQHGFEVRSGPGLPSIWGKLVDEKQKAKHKNAETWFRKNFGLLVYDGESFNASKWYARINLLISTKDYDRLLERLECK